MKSKGIQLIDNSDEGTVMDMKIIPVRDGSGLITQGLVIGKTLEQNKALILIAHQGELFANPDLGVGIADVTLSSDYLEFRHRIREHFLKDGLVVSTLDFYENKPLKIIADYE